MQAEVSFRLILHPRKLLICGSNKRCLDLPWAIGREGEGEGDGGGEWIERRRNRHLKHLIGPRIVFPVDKWVRLPQRQQKSSFPFRHSPLVCGLYVCVPGIYRSGRSDGWGYPAYASQASSGTFGFCRMGGPNMVGVGVGVGVGMSFFDLPAKSRISGSDCTPDGSPSPLTRSGGALLPATGDRISRFIGSNPLPSVGSPGFAVKSEESSPLGNRLGSGAAERKGNRKGT